MGLADRVETLAETGIDALLMMHYTLDLAANSPEEFVEQPGETIPRHRPLGGVQVDGRP